MKYLLDTNICIYIIKKKPEQVLQKLLKINPEKVSISSITFSELVYGAEKSAYKQKNLEALQSFVAPFEILEWTQKAAASAGQIRALLEKSGKTIGAYDILIAAHAISLDITLVTNNENEFSRVKNLKFENWAKE